MAALPGRRCPPICKEIATSLLPIILMFGCLPARGPQAATSGTIGRIAVGLAVHLYGPRAIPHRRKRGLYARRVIIWGRCWPGQSFRWVLIPIGHAHRLLHRQGRARRLCAEQAGGGGHRRRHLRPGHGHWLFPSGVALSVGLAMVRVLTGISILWFLIPGYIIRHCHLVDRARSSSPPLPLTPAAWPPAP